jgi:hypothetical protein
MKKAAKAAGKNDQQSLVDRLRKTDTDFYTTESADYQQGVAAGEAWVREVAEARYLRQLEKVWESEFRPELASAEVGDLEEANDVMNAVTFEEHDGWYARTTVSAKQRFGDKGTCRPDNDIWPRKYTLGFFDGALALWRSVKPEIPDPTASKTSKSAPKKKSSK